MNIVLRSLPCVAFLSIVLCKEEKFYASNEVFSMFELVNLAANLDSTLINLSDENDDETKINSDKSIRRLSFLDVISGNWNKDEHRIKSLEKTITNMWRELNETSEEKATCHVSLQSELKKITTLTQHLTKALTKVKVTTKEHETLLSNYDDMRNKFRSIERNARTSEKKYIILDGRYVDLKRTNEELEKKMTKLTAKFESFESKRFQFDEEMRSLKNKNNFMASRFKELEKQHEKYKMENVRLEKKYADYTDKLSSLKYDYERLQKCDY